MTQILADTSVWRRFLSGDTAARPLSALLVDGKVLSHPWVIGELVLGGLAMREELLLRGLPNAPLVSDDEVLTLVHHRRLMRRGIGWVGANLLASARIAAASLWTFDKALAKAAADLDITPELP